MAVTPILADSSYYIQLLRQGRDPLRVLALAAATRDVAICGVVRAEVGRAIVPQRVREKFRAAWDVMINVPSDGPLWTEVECLAWEFDRKGRVLPLTDIVIACSALRIGATILTRDKHFHEVPGLRVVEELEI